MATGWRKHTGYERVPFGAWVAARRKELGWTLQTLAQMSGIKHKATLKGVEDGKRGLSKDSRKMLVTILSEEDARVAPQSNRRKFLRDSGMALAGLALAGAVSQVVYAEKSAQWPRREASKEQLERDELAHDLGESCIASWDKLLYKGEARFVLDDAVRRYLLLKHYQHFDDEEITLTAIRIGLRIGRAQETVYDWYKRCPVAIATYDDIERLIKSALQRPGNKAITRAMYHEYARLLALRAPLLREVHAYEASEINAAAGIKLAQRNGDVLLLADILRNRAHIAAIYGKRESWETKLVEAQNALETSSQHGQGHSLDLLTYYRGEGNKRLAFNLHASFSEKERIAFADKAIANFKEARQQLEANWSNYVLGATVSGHPLLMQVSEAQCYVWADPQVAVSRLEQLRHEAMIGFPALLGKIELALSYAVAVTIQDGVAVAGRLGA